jgi:hypothetical protein
MRATTNLVLDVVIGAAFLVAANPSLVGRTIHEWFGLAFAAAVVVHLVLHLEWIVAAPRRLVTSGRTGLRLNSAVDAFLYVAMTASILSGLMISTHVLPALGLPAEPARAWRGIHSLAANASVAAMGVHLGLHWNWIALNVPRLVGIDRRRAAAGSAPASALSAAGASLPSAAR